MTNKGKYNKVHSLIMQGDYADIQSTIDDGTAWRLEGHYGRIAMEALKDGHCILADTVHRDYYGNKIPAYYEVQAGTQGSLELAQERYAQEAVTV